MIEYVKAFDEWNQKKKVTDAKLIDRSLYIHEREVWWSSIGVNVGSEVDGKNENFERPVLVAKVISGGGFFGIPLTTKQKGHRYEVVVRHDKGVVYANVSQLRFFSSKRLLRKVGVVDQSSFSAVMSSIRTLFS
jgi:mRNA interferase MazF